MSLKLCLIVSVLLAGARSQFDHHSFFHDFPVFHGPSFPSTPIRQFSDLVSSFKGQCATRPSGCRHSQYRSIDGTCNNPNNPALGAAMTQYGRLFTSNYADGESEPARSQESSRQLPSPRQISSVLFPDADIKDPLWTLLAMQYGQIITHDMSMAAGTAQFKPHNTQCCSSDGSSFILRDESSCLPIEIPPNDPHYGPAGIRCMNFVRSATDACQHGPAQQLSSVTAYLDASLVYGSDQNTATSLRLFQGGRLIVEERDGRQFPPSSTNKSSSCDNVLPGEPCYVTGDQRVNQNPQLTILQIILLREHNRLADTLSQLNPHWDDERIYQEARRILIAEHQHIVYREWLPIFLGETNMRTRGLLFDGPGYSHDYDPTVDPSVLNEHATAAFRYFHTNIAGFLHLVSEYRHGLSALRLSDHFNRPQIIEERDNFDNLVRGMSAQSQQGTDQFFSKEITLFLFRNGRALGRDLRSIDIQRGRDHGLASYNQAREKCGLSAATSFHDFQDVISQENVNLLSALYEHPDDVDLTVGGSLEAHVPGSLAGPTFLCILTEQFRRTRAGDRFFYENGEKPGAFTIDQLEQIRRSSISRLLCDNSDEVNSMQPRAFTKISAANPIVPCNQLDYVDLSPWRENHLWVQ